MRKQTKLAVVLAAAALLAVGSASIVSAAGWVQEGAEWRYQDASGDYVTEAMKKSGDTTFYLDENGYMAKDYFCNYNENYYYFGSNGAMVRNTWVAIDPSLVDSGEEDVDAYWYYFQDTGKAFKGGDSDIKKKKIDGKTYFFNSDGQMLTGWFDSTGEKFDVANDNDFVETTADVTVYYAGDDGVARGGWLAYTDGLSDEKKIGNSNIDDRATIYFYFNTANFKRVQGKEKTINGKKYRFNESGIMMTGWEYFEGGENGAADYSAASLSRAETYKYYSGEDDGHLVKKGWVYAVPSELLDSEKNYDDEEAYFYFSNSGEMVKGEQKRINGKYYVFNGSGEMKTGLVFLNSSNEYQFKIDTEYTDGAKWIKDGEYYTGDPAKNDSSFPTYAAWKAYTGADKKDKTYNGPKYSKNEILDGEYSIHYYGADGAKVTGNKVLVEFADDTFVFASKNNGGFVGEKKKKFYSNGFLLKATDDIRLGLVYASDSNARGYKGDQTEFTYTTASGETKICAHFPVNVDETNANACYVVTTSGAKKKKGAYKDADGNYWLVNDNKCLVGIYDVQVKFTTDDTGAAVCQWKGNVGPGKTYMVNKTIQTAGTDGKDDTYIDFGYEDKNGKTQNDHLVSINNDYCLNFTVKND